MSNPIRYIIYGDGRDFRSQPNNWIFYLVWGIFTFCMGIIYLLWTWPRHRFLSGPAGL